MHALRSGFPDRSARILLLVLSCAALLCTQIPLFNYLGFEFSALMALMASYASGLYVLLYARARRGKQAACGTDLFKRNLIPSLFFLFPPFVIIALNGIVIKNCSFPQGLMFYLLLPLPAVLFTNALAVFIASATARWRIIWFTAIYGVILFHIGIVTFAAPQIFAFNPILGFFPGITYDETMEIGWRLLLYRVSTLVAAALLVLLASFAQNQKQRRAAKRASSGELAAGLAAFALLAAMFGFSDDLGLSSSEGHIRKELGGELTTNHFVIIYPVDRVSAEKAAKIAELHEFYFSHLTKELRAFPDKKIRSFIYADENQKGRLIGASGTNIAKPWLWQLHINLDDVPAVLKHELVHVLAADFGFPLLRIGLNSGLIEGLAMAAERVEYDETLHRLAGQVFEVGVKPDMESLFSLTGFFKAHGGTSYVLAGSFCRYLIDQYGMRRFKWLYRTGSFKSFYNKDLQTLLAEWRRFISEPKPSSHELMKAAYLFRRPSIFGKECARVIAGLNMETRALLKAQRWDEALESSRRSLDLTRSPEAITLHATSLFRLKKYEDVIGFVTEKLNDSTIAHTLLPLLLPLGDSYWAAGRFSEAREQYERLYFLHLSVSWDEAAALRLEALKRPSSEKLADFFITEMDDSSRMAWLEAKRTRNSLVQYILGRELMGNERYEEALKVLTRIYALDSGVLEYIRFRRVARLYFELKQYQKAKVYFWESLNFTSKSSHQIETTEWLERCDWMEERSGGDEVRRDGD